MERIQNIEIISNGYDTRAKGEILINSKKIKFDTKIELFNTQNDDDQSKKYLNDTILLDIISKNLQ